MHLQKIQPEDIFIMGFSQGGLMALDQYLHNEKLFAGIVALSPRVRLPANIKEFISKDKSKTSIFVGHGHEDIQIAFEETERNINQLKKLNSNIEFHSYEMGHSICIEEIHHLRDWLNERL